ncbi:MAG: YihY/virulence factor BrkB family protein [Saprospiraceae bacterium]
MSSKDPILNTLEKILGKQKLNTLTHWAQRTSLPGLSKVPVYDIVVFLYHEARRERIMDKVNSLAFSFLLALFPFFLFLFTLIPLLPVHGINDELIRGLKPFIPDSVEPFLFKTLEDVISVKRGGLLSISFFMALYFSTNATQAMMTGFEKSYKETFRRRNFWQKRLDALKLVFLVALLVIFSVVILIFGNEIWSWLVSYFSSRNVVIDSPDSKDNWVVKFLFLKNYSGIVFGLFQAIISFFLFQGIFAAIFRFGAAFRQKAKFFSAGTTLAAVSSIIISLIFSFSINKFGSFHLIYGPIGALIIILLYIQLNCFIIIACFELNASIAVNRDIKKVIVD